MTHTLNNTEHISVETNTSTVYYKGKSLPTVEQLRKSNDRLFRRIISSNELIHGSPITTGRADKRKRPKTDIQTSHNVQTPEARID